MLAEMGYAASGIDISPTAIAWAIERDAASEAKCAVDFRAGDASDLPFGDATFDAVLDGNCLHCIVGDDRARVFGEIRRVLRPKGFLFLSSMVGDPKDETDAARFDFQSRCQMSEGVAERYMPTEASLLEELSRHGYRVLSHQVHVNPRWDHLFANAVIDEG